MGVLIQHTLSSKVLITFVAALCFFVPASAKADDNSKLQLQEQTIKAGLVYNFLKYTTWPGDLPSTKQSSLRICFFGKEPLDGNLSRLEGRTAQKSTISIVHVDDISKTADCSVVFINRDNANILPALFSFLKDKHVLTVSDIDEFAKLGGMIELTKEDKRIALYINKSAVDRAGLTIQTRLLKLAKMVSG